MKPSLTRRSLLALGGAATLAACSAPAAQQASAMYVSWYGGNPVHKAMQANLDAFGAGHAGLKITSNGVAFGDYWDRLATETAAKGAPDVFRMSMSYFSEYADRGALLDLGQAAESAIRTKDLDPDVFASGRIGDKLYGIGQSSISHAAFRNPELVASVGGTLPKEWDWKQLAEFATGFAGEAGDGKWGVADIGGNLQMFEVYARQHGTDLFGEQGWVVPDEVVADWFAYWQDLRTAKAAPPGNVTAESGDFETSTLAKGTAPINFGWVQQVTFYQPLVTDAALEVAPLPGDVSGSLKGQFLKALDFWCVSARSSAVEVAEQLIDFLVNDPVAIRSTGLLLGVPPSGAARDALGAAADTAEGRAIAYVEAIADKVGPAPGAWPKGYGQLLTDFTRFNQDIAFNRSTPAKAATDFAAAAKQALS